MRSAEAEDRKFQEERKSSERKTDREEAEKQIEKEKDRKKRVCLYARKRKSRNGTINAGRY